MSHGGNRQWTGMLAVLLLAALLPILAPDMAGALPGAPSVGASDDFEAPNLDLHTWTLVDPTDRGHVGITLSSLAIAPGGDSWEVDNSTRIEQVVEDESFDLALEVPSLPVAAYSTVGATLQAESAWLQIGLTGTLEGPAVVAIANGDGTPLVRLKHPIAPDTTRLRIRRLGPQYFVWTAPPSGDWRLAGSFIENLEVQRLALFGSARDLDAPPVAIAELLATESVAKPTVDTVAPLIHGVITAPQGTDLRVTFFTEELARSSLVVDDGTLIEGDGTLANEHEITIPDVANGAVVTFTPMAEDESGNSSEGPVTEVRFTEEGLPVIDVWYGDRQTFGRNGVPQRWVNILGNVSDGDGIASLTYALDDQAPKALAVGPSDRRLAVAGDFNADFLFDELNPGEHTVQLRATDALGNTNTRSVTVVIAQTLGLPIPHDVVWANAAGSSLNDIVQVVDGKWEVQEDGTLRTAEIGYDRLVAVGDRRWSDYEVEFPVTIHDVSPEGYGAIDGKPSVGVTVGWTGHVVLDDTQPAWGFWPSTGAAGLYWDTLDEIKMTVQGNNAIPSQSTPTVRIPLDTTIRMRIRVERLTEGPRISMKAWGEGGTPPADWAVFVTDDDDTEAGSIAIVAHHTDVSIGDVTIQPLSP